MLKTAKGAEKNIMRKRIFSTQIRCRLSHILPKSLASLLSVFFQNPDEFNSKWGLDFSKNGRDIRSVLRIHLDCKGLRGITSQNWRPDLGQSSRFHSRPQIAFGMRIYERSGSFVRLNPKFGAKLAITLENEHF